MQLFLFILLMAGLTALNYRVSRSLLYPPALFASVWTALLALLWLTSETYYAISSSTMLVYFAGAAAFSAGGFIPMRLFGQIFATRMRPVMRRPGPAMLTGGLLVLVALLPLFWDYVQYLGYSASAEDFWRSVRVESIATSDDWASKTLASFAWEGSSLLAVLLATTAVAEHTGSRFSRIQMFLIIALGLLYGLMTGTSAGAVSLTLGLIGIDAIRHRRLRGAVTAIGLTVAIASFGITASMLSKGSTDAGASLAENLSGIAELVGLYALGGVIGFDAVVEYPASITPVWSMWRNLQLTANKFGADYDVPSVHAQYTDVSNYYDTNVYTMYFSYYPDYGLAGVCVVMFFLGIALTVVYQKAVHGNPRSILLYAFVFSGILLSGFSEHFFLGANFWAKAILYTMLAYRFAPGSAVSSMISEAAPRFPIRHGQGVMS